MPRPLVSAIYKPILLVMADAEKPLTLIQINRRLRERYIAGLIRVWLTGDRLRRLQQRGFLEKLPKRRSNDTNEWIAGPMMDFLKERGIIDQWLAEEADKKIITEAPDHSIMHLFHLPMANPRKHFVIKAGE